MSKKFLRESYEKTKEVILNPKKFFKKNKDDLGKVGKYLLLILIVPAIATIAQRIYLTYQLNYLSEIMPQEILILAQYQLLSSPFIGIISSYIMSIIMYALTSLILHLMWMVFGGKGDVEDSFRTVVYGSAPYILLSWIPLSGFIIGLYCLYLITIGGAITHKISNTRSLLAIIIIPVTLIILFSVLLINFLPYLYQYVSQVLSTGVIDLNNTGINNSLFYY